jgi:type IV secretion system protein VirB6
MTCPAILSGQSFLATTLVHIDCQAQAIGAYGWGALSQPGSPTIAMLTALLTVLIALFGIRLMLGTPLDARDLVGDMVRIGIALTIATSWPAWRVLGYDLIVNGPGELFRTIAGSAGLPGAGGDLFARLQRVDEGLAALTVLGSGRLGVAQGDWFQLGLARDAYLAGVIAPQALVRLMAGLLLALAPLVAGLLLLGVTRSVFVGWAKALVSVFFAALAVSVIQAAQLAMLEPWLQDVLARRGSEQQLLEAPVEVLAITLAFALVAFGAIALCARFAFQSGAVATVLREVSDRFPARSSGEALRPASEVRAAGDSFARAVHLANAVSETIRREERRLSTDRLSVDASAARSSAALGLSGEPLGTSYRRTRTRSSAAGQRRDQTR